MCPLQSPPPKMSGVEVIGAISGIITILETIIRFGEACRDLDVKGIPSSIRDAHARLPLVIVTLSLLDNDIRSNPDSDSYHAMKKALNACEKKASSLERMFRAGMPPELPRPSLRRRITTAALMTFRMGKSRKVDSLMKGILEDIQLLADNHAFNNSTRYRIRESTQALMQGDWRRNVPFPLASELAVVIPSAYGPTSHPPSRQQGQPSGHQNTHLGVGAQYFHIYGGGILNINSG